MNIKSLIIGAAFGLSLTAAPAKAAVTVQSLTVGSHNQTSSISTADIQDDFDYATDDVIWNDSGSGDVLCELALHMTGNAPGPDFSAGDDNVNNSTEFWDIVNNSGYYVNIVDTLTWCGSTGDWAGCAPVNTEEPFVITRGSLLNTVGGVVLSHEFAHTVGASHDTSTLNFMNASVGSNNVRVESYQCNYLREPVNQNGGTSIEGATAGSSTAGDTEEKVNKDKSLPKKGAAADYSNVPIEELAQMVIVDTMPVEVEDYYGQEDVAILKDMLADPDLEAQHKTVLMLIGLISDGSASDVYAVTDYMTDRREQEKQDNAAGLALGYIVSRSGNQEALQFLSDAASSADEGLAEGAALGLGVSGNGQARSTLEQMKRNGKKVDQLIEDNYAIEAEGLRAYYTK